MTARSLPLPIAITIALGLATATASSQDAPRIVALDPPDFAGELDATATTRLTISFDRDMDTSGHGIAGDRALLPTITGTQWLDRRTFRLQVMLQADRIHALDLSRTSQPFVSAEGVAAPMTAWRFATRGEPLPDGTVELALDRLRTALQDHYSRRNSRGVDWQRVERDHRDQLDACRSGPALALELTSMLAHGQDVDVEVLWGKTSIASYAPPEPLNFALRGLATVLPRLERIEHVGLVARTDDAIGYLQVESFALQRRELDLLLHAARSLHDCIALVIDVRGCNSGDEGTARRLAATLIAGEHTYALHRERDAAAESGFSEPVPHVLRGSSAAEVFSGPIAVLTGPHVRDAGELFLLMMQQSRSVVLVGTRSYGAVGNPRPHRLTPGLAVLLPDWLLLRPNGATFDGEGVEPTITVVSTPAEHLAGDPVLSAALDRLRGRR